MRLLAEEAGRVIVTLNVTWSHNGVERTFTDIATVLVCLQAQFCLWACIVVSQRGSHGVDCCPNSPVLIPTEKCVSNW